MPKYQLSELNKLLDLAADEARIRAFKPLNEVEKLRTIDEVQKKPIRYPQQLAARLIQEIANQTQRRLVRAAEVALKTVDELGFLRVYPQLPYALLEFAVRDIDEGDLP